jgi:hypothetical protein
MRSLPTVRGLRASRATAGFAGRRGVAVVRGDGTTYLGEAEVGATWVCMLTEAVDKATFAAVLDEPAPGAGSGFRVP